MLRFARSRPSLRVSLPAGFVALATTWGLAAAAPVLTVADGPVALLRAARFSAGTGTPLRHGDVLEVGDRGLAVVEFDEASVVALGPAAKAMLGPGDAGPPEVFVLAGAAKASARGAARVRLSSPSLSVVVSDASVVLRVDGGESSVFAESGSPTIDAGGTRTPLKAGGLLTHRAGRPAAVLARPPATFAASLPAAFLDPLPSQWARFKGRPAAPMTQREFTYAEVEAWLTSVPSVRRVLVGRWRARAQDPAFRRALVANMKRHPEWERVVRPAEPADPPVPDAAAGRRPARPDPVNRPAQRASRP